MLLIAVIGLMVIAGVSFGGYYLSKNTNRPDDLVSPSPETSPLLVPTADPTPEQILSPAPTAPSETFSPLPTAPARTPVNEYQTPPPSGQSESSTESIAIKFVRIPTSLSSGQPFSVIWAIDGPVGTRGENTKIEVFYNVSSQSGSGSGSSSSKTSQSFGSFTVPRQFSANLSFGGSSGPLLVKISAVVNGKIYTAEKTIQLK